MSRIAGIRAALAGALVLLLSGACIGARFYRPESVIAKDGYDLTFVELDDQGELWSPEQVVRATEAIREAGTTGPGAILVVFIHGWQHNAAPGDENIAGFESMLQQVVRVERLRNPGEVRRIVGVYVGWRGKTSVLRPLRLLSFSSRFRAARRVASTAATETLHRLLLAGRINPANTTVVGGAAPPSLARHRRARSGLGGRPRERARRRPHAGGGGRAPHRASAASVLTATRPRGKELAP